MKRLPFAALVAGLLVLPPALPAQATPFMIINSVRLAATIAVAASPVGLAAQDGETAPCPRAAGILLVERGAIQDVVNEPPYSLFFRRTGVRLTAAPDGSRPDPGQLVVKDGRGRYYSTNADGWESTISVWSADGAYLTSFGGAGEGPGEFRDESLALFVDAGDSLHVLDSRAWTVFSPEHEYARQVPARQMGSGNLLDEQETFVPYYDGRILASSPHPSTESAYFRIVNRDGSLDGTFGTSDEGTSAGGHYGHGRAMAYSAGYKYFWAAPSLEGAAEYVLEEWDVTGAEGLPAEREERGLCGRCVATSPGSGGRGTETVLRRSDPCTSPSTNCSSFNCGVPRRNTAKRWSGTTRS